MGELEMVALEWMTEIQSEIQVFGDSVLPQGVIHHEKVPVLRQPS